MKSIVKISSLVLLSTLFLCGCGNGLVHEHEVSANEFAEAAIATVGTNTYNLANLTGKYKEYVDSVEQQSDVNIQYNYINGSWQTSTVVKFSLDHAYDDAISFSTIFAIASNPDLHYMIADNGFRLKGNATYTLGGLSFTIEAEYIYNEFGYPTKKYYKNTGELVTSKINHKEGIEKSASISYQSVN